MPHLARRYRGTYTTFNLGGSDYAEVTGSHILNAGGQSVIAVATVQNPRTFNFENNWWGTADSTQVEEWIFHAPDDPEETGLTIDYSPLAHEPVPTESSSLGGLKGRFRRTGSSGQE